MGNFFRCVRARANLHALMTQKSCAVGMRNAILRNHLKRLQMEDSFFGQKETGAERVAMATALRASFCFFCDGQLWCQVSRALL